MYPRNAASPERIAVGAVVLIADGTVQTSGVSITVTPQGGASGAGGGTTAYEQGVVLYTPTQAETNYPSFVVTAYKASCIPVAVTVITSASATTGYAGLDWGMMANKTTTNALTNTSVNLSATGLDAITQSATGMVEIAKAVWDRVLTGATHNIASSAGRRLRTASGGQLDAGTAQAGTASSITLATSASTTAGQYVGCMIAIDGGTGAGQSRYIVGYSTGRVASVARHWTTTPDNTSTYVLFADNQVSFIHMGTAQGGGASSITLGSDASSVNDLYKGQCIRVLDGTGDDQERMITAYNGTTKVATVDRAWATQPVSGDYYGTLMGSTSYGGGGMVDTVTTATNLTNAPTAGDLTATMKTSVTTAATAATPTAAAVTAAVTLPSIPANWITAAGLAADAGLEIADAVWDEATSGHSGAGTTGLALTSASAPSAATVADAVWDEILSGHAIVGSTGAALSAAGGSGDPWSTALPGAYGAGTAGKIIGDNINAAISSRMATYTQPTGFLAATFPGTVASTTNITTASGVTLAATTHTGAVIPTVSTVTGLTASNLDTTVSSRSTYAGGAVASVTGNVGGNVVGSVGSVASGVTVTTNNDKTGYGLSSTAVQAVWDAMTSALTTAGSIGKKLADWVIGTTQTGDSFARLGAPSGASIAADVAAVKGDTAAIKAKTDNLPAAPAAVSNIPTAVENADALLDRANAIETGLTLRQAHRLEVAAAAGKVSGAATTTVVLRNAVADSKARITATVDADGNRSAVTTDVS